MLDSVFSPILARFQQEDEEIPYADDEPILGRKEITESLDSIEDKFSNLLVASAWTETDKHLKKIEPFLKNSDRPAIEKEKWAIAVPMQGLLYGLWNESWGLGENHAVKELNIVYAKNAGKKAEFKKRDEPVYLAYPPDYGIPLTASVLREAVEQRTLKLANDVSDQTAARIQSYVLDAVDKHKTNGVPPSERKLLVRRINGILGRQRQEESLSDLPPEERAKTTVRVPGTSAFHKRARLIAGTELSAAYSLGRLQVYTQAEIKKVRWQALSDLRTCPLCRSRNGTVHDLGAILAQQQFANRGIYDPAQYVIPCHPIDRCHWQPVLDEVDDRDSERSRDDGRNPTLRQIVQLRQAWSLAGTAINVANVVGGVVQRQRQEAELIERQRQQQTQRLLFLGGAAALSLGALYMLLRQQQPIQPRQSEFRPQIQSSRSEEIIAQTAVQLRQRQQQQQIEQQPVRPEQVLTPELQQRYARLAASGIDLRSVTSVGLQASYGVNPRDVTIIRELVRQYQQRQTIPPERALVPQSLLPQNILQQYPQLRSVPDVRNLSVDDLVRLGVSRAQSQRLQQLIQESIRSSLALPPARTSSSGLAVGNLDLNSALPEQIAALLTRIPQRNRAAVAQRIWEFLRRRELQGRPVSDVSELAQVEGVGAVTIRNLIARNYTNNLNNLLLQLGDNAAADVIAGQLEIGPGLALEVVREFRQGGQFGYGGVTPVEDLIARMVSRVNRRGSKLTLSEDAIARIRARLSGTLYTIPTPQVQPSPVVQAVGEIPQLTPLPSQLTPTTPTPISPTTSTAAPNQLSPTSPPVISPTVATSIVTTTVAAPRRYQPPISRDGSIIVGSQEMSQQENRDRIMRGVQMVEQQVAEYQSRLASTVRNAKSSDVRRNAPNLGTQIQSATTRQQDALRKTTVARTRLNTSAALGQNVIPELEQATSRIEGLLQDLSDPLAPPYFNNAGNLSAGVSKQIQNLEREIDNRLAEITYNLNSPEREAQRLNTLIGELQRLRRESAIALENAASSPSTPLAVQKFELLQNLQRQLDELNSQLPMDVGDEFFRSVGQIRDRFTDLLQSQSNLDRSDVVTRITGQIATLENSIARMSRSRNAGALSTLTETREQLISLRDRLSPSNLPRRVSSLTPEQQSTWRTTNQVRSRVRAATTSLQSSLDTYRQRIRAQVEQIRAASQSEEWEQIVRDLEVVQDDGLTLYQQDRRAALESNQNLIAETFATLDDNLNQLRMVADPNIGIRYVIQNIPEVLEETTTVTTTSLSLPRRVAPRGLDEAAEIRRTAINNLKGRIDHEPPEGRSGGGIINRLERILDYDSPRRVTEARLATIDQQIAVWENLRNSTALNTSRYAATVRADLEALRRADPIAYAEIKPQKILQEIEYNAAFQARGFEQRLQRLRAIRERVQQDLSAPISYQARPNQTLAVPELRTQLSRTRNEVRSIGRTRRQELDALWRKVVAAGADADSLAGRIRDNRGRMSSGVQGSYLTPNQKRLLSELNDDEWRTLVDSVESGAFDLYKELGRLSGKKVQWEQLADQKWQETQDALRELESKYGYRMTVRQEPDGTFFLSEMEDIETNPNRFRRGRNPGNVLAKIRGATGVGSGARVNLDDPRNYVDIQAALRKNMEERQAIDRRLEVLNFNQKLRLAEFKKGKLLRSHR